MEQEALTQQAYMIYLQNRRREKKQIRGMGNLFGAALLMFLLIQNLMSYAMYFLGLYEQYRTNVYFQNGYEILACALSILLPFFIFSRVGAGADECRPPLQFVKRKSLATAVLCVPCGVAACLAASVLTSYITALLGMFGISLSQPQAVLPESTGEFIYWLVRSVAAAAIVEETALRGFALSRLRQVSDGFAVCMSSIIFALMHINLIQAPFALIAGLVLAVITLKTESIWPSVIIHMINNLISCSISYYSQQMDEVSFNALFNIIIYSFILVGTLCGAVLLARLVLGGHKESIDREKRVSWLGAGQKAQYFLTSPAMLLAIIIMLYHTAGYIDLK